MLRRLLAAFSLGATLAASATAAHAADAALDAAVAGQQRAAEHVARDAARHPVESLTFWGLKPAQTVIEISPGSGYWTEILGPYAKATGGRYVAGVADLDNPKTSEGARKGRAAFEAKYADTARFGPIAYVGFGAESKPLGAPGSADLVITDLAMPGMTGIDLIREARSRGEPGEFVVLTAVGSVPTAVQAVKSGAFEFLEKPVRFDQLRATVEAAMRQRREKAMPVRTIDVVEERPVTDPGGVPVGASPSGAAVAGAPPPLPAGDAGQTSFSRIGRYEIVELIGRGGMGEVFRCRDPLLGRAVAVKIMRLTTDRPGRTAELLARFQREAAAAGALPHPGIVAVHDLGRDPALGLWYIVLELVEGRSLDRILEERHRLPAEEAVSLAFQVADALPHLFAFLDNFQRNFFSRQIDRLDRVG
jgi:CheY-like chemotaxis protein